MAQITWEPKQVATTADVYDLTFTPDSTGWAVTFNPAHVLKSTDHGETWAVNATFPSMLLKAVVFKDNLTGWVSGVNGNNNIPVIYTTTDGGQNWMAEVVGGSPVCFGLGSLNTLDVLETGQVVSFGHNGLERIRGNAVSDDWYPYYGCFTTEHIWAAQVLNDEFIYVAADQIYVYSEDDFGDLAWTVSFGNDAHDLHFISQTVGYAVTPTKVIKKTSASPLWVTITDPSPLLSTTSIGNIIVGSSGVLYIGGFNGEIYLSQDEGVNWYLSRSEELPGQQVTGLFEYNNKIWVVGTDGMIETRTDYISGIDQIESQVGLSVHPNPTSDILQVKSSIKPLQVRLFNSAGQMMFSSSRNVEQIDVSSLQSGMYHLEAIYKNSVQRRRFVKR